MSRTPVLLQADRGHAHRHLPHGDAGGSASDDIRGGGGGGGGAPMKAMPVFNSTRSCVNCEPMCLVLCVSLSVSIPLSLLMLLLSWSDTRNHGRTQTQIES